MMRTSRSGQKLRLLIIEALKNYEGFGGKQDADITIGRIMGIMGIEEKDVKGAPKESHAELVERCHREMTSDLGDSP